MKETRMEFQHYEDSRMDSLKLIEAARNQEPSQFWQGRRYSVSRMPKIATFIREKYDSEDYYPLVVSLGPYHHGHPSLRSGEEFKPRALKSFALDSGKHEGFWLDVVRHVTGDLRESYVEVSTDKYDDDEFARMMLQDACLAIMLMTEVIEDQNESLFKLLSEHLGMGAFLPMTRDLHVFENQLPFWFLESMLYLRYGKELGVDVVRKFLAKVSLVKPDDFEPINISSDDFGVDAPVHLVEALQRLVVGERPEINPTSRISSAIPSRLVIRARKMCGYGVRLFGGTSKDYSGRDRDIEEQLVDSFHSITELKAKGIHIGPSGGASCNDIKFHSSYLYGTLQLPMFYATILTRPFYSNIIVYEMSPGSRGDVIVTAYVSFLKSMIQSPKDVKELRNKGILTSVMGGDEEVMKLFNSIDTFGIDSSLAYGNVRAQIQKHYNSYTKTWVAEFFHSYFRSPWTIASKEDQQEI
ncbi:hypothetical protein Leryth_013820 [Lithospermum erythrorhizon]|nr:hypothetical protein Leryth_013820 [Lithospermum erythrorhizon]